MINTIGYGFENKTLSMSRRSIRVDCDHCCGKATPYLYPCTELDAIYNTKISLDNDIWLQIDLRYEQQPFTNP